MISLSCSALILTFTALPKCNNSVKKCAWFPKVLSEEVKMNPYTVPSYSVHCNVAAPYEICSPILTHQLILWLEFKAAAALAAVIKHKTEEIRGKKDKVQ